jgi:hypothetical protein
MREVTGPPIEPLATTAHLLQPVIARAAKDPGRAPPTATATTTSTSRHTSSTGAFAGSPRVSSGAACRRVTGSP